MDVKAESLPGDAAICHIISAGSKMPKKPWTESAVVDGIMTVELKGWSSYEAYIREEMLDYRNFIWRGQASAAWPLESTLDRILRKQGKSSATQIREMHLRRFIFSTRGRRGINPAKVDDENGWWALGQHYGLFTPLLDWSTSPYVAAYFAYIAQDNDSADRRAIFGLSRTAVQRKSDEIRSKWKKKVRPPIVELVEPQSDENTRLVNQGGLFTRAPDAVTVDDWVRANFAGVDDYVRILKIVVPNSDRLIALRSLNRMNINHLSLFPDLVGASSFANLDLLIDDY
jgi:hypothetical protein